jgi:hypothetical protein
MEKANNKWFKFQLSAIVLIAIGYGWAGGHYIPADANLLAYLFQFVVLGILLFLAIPFLSLPADQPLRPRWPVNGLTIFSIISFIINLANIIHGAFNTNPKGFGSHNTFPDIVPIAFLIAGSGLWLITILSKKYSTSRLA